MLYFWTMLKAAACLAVLCRCSNKAVAWTADPHCEELQQHSE